MEGWKLVTMDSEEQQRYKEKLKQLAQELITHETLDESELDRILDGLVPQAASS
jgi:ATP-dependent Zn protease